MLISKLKGTTKWLKFIIRNRNYFKAYGKLVEVKNKLILINIELRKLNYESNTFSQRIREFNQCTINYIKGKWYMTKAIERKSKEHWKNAFKIFNESIKLGEKIYEYLLSGCLDPIKFNKSTITSNNTEINFADGVPLVPEINPICILKGSDYEMGYQYAQQLIEIFGSWILEKKANREFTSKEREYIREWEKQLSKYTPEILRMIEGWAAGAKDAGVSMSYEDVLELWTGHKPPEINHMGIKEGPPDRLPLPLCSGLAAWGNATVDGELITGSSGDHDCTFMVTIIAFPETGNNYIISFFSAIGDIPFIGNQFMFGHPGLNNKGLAYVHHGGEPKMIEKKNLWGYGLRRGASILHILRFANNAKKARDIELSYPVGDVGFPNGTIGGFYADKTYGYVIESRKDPLIIRDAEEENFLYANNSVIHQKCENTEWIKNYREEWLWDKNGGWFPSRFKNLNLFHRDKDLMANVLKRMKFIYNNSYYRNLYLYNMMKKAVGSINLDYVKMIYRFSSEFPSGDFKELIKDYKKNGTWGRISTGSPSNALVSIMKPENGDGGVYSLCVGPEARGLAPTGMRPIGKKELNGNPIFGETNAFWELRLDSNPLKVVLAARKKAEDYIKLAYTEFKKHEIKNNNNEFLEDLLNSAKDEYNRGSNFQNLEENAEKNYSLYNYARALRAFTRAQVRALQGYNYLSPPPNKPENFGF